MSRHIQLALAASVWCVALSSPSPALQAPLLVQDRELRPPQTVAGDWYGTTVALSGDTLAVGAPWHDTGVPEGGVAYVYQRDSEGWHLRQVLQPGYPAALDRFGWAVALDGDTLAIAAIDDDDAAANAGAVYVYRRSASGWSLEQKLSADDSDWGQDFGVDVDVSGDLIVVGAHYDSQAGSIAGAAYVFQRSGSVWNQVAKLIGSDTDDDDVFGRTVACEGLTVLVGAPDADGAFDEEGRAYVFERLSAGWTQTAELVPGQPSAGLHFGLGVDLAPDLLVVTAAGAHSTASVFERDTAGWTPSAVLTPVTGAVLSTNPAIAPRRLLLSLGDGYVLLERRGKKWETVQSIGSCRGLPTADAALDVDWAAIGAGDYAALGSVETFELRSGRFVRLCLGDESAVACPCANPGKPGNGCANGAHGAGAHLAADGSASLSKDDMSLIAGGSTPRQPGVFYQSESALSGGLGVPFADGLRCIGPSLARVEIANADPCGNARTSVSLAGTSGVLVGSSLYYQWWYRDPVLSPCGAELNSSNAVEIVWLP